MAAEASKSESDSHSNSGSESSEDDYLSETPIPPPPTTPHASYCLAPDSVLCIQCGLSLPKVQAVRHFQAALKSWRCLRCHRHAQQAAFCLEQRGEAAAWAKDLAQTRKAGALLSMQQSALLNAIDVKSLDIEKLRVRSAKSSIWGRINKERERQSTIADFMLKLKEEMRLVAEKVDVLRGEQRGKMKEEADLAGEEVDPLYREVQKLEQKAIRRRSILRKSVPWKGMNGLVCADCTARLSKTDPSSSPSKPCLGTKSCTQQCLLM